MIIYKTSFLQWLFVSSVKTIRHIKFDLKPAKHFIWCQAYRLMLYGRFLFIIVGTLLLSIQITGCVVSTTPLSESKNPSQLIQTGDQLFKEGNYLQSQKLLEQAVEQAKNSNDSFHEGLALKHLSSTLIALEKYPEALHKAKASLRIAKTIDDHSLARNALNSIGRAYYWSKDYDKAIDAFKQATFIPEKSAADNWKVLDNLGLTYYWQTDYKNAIDAYQKALVYAEQDGSPIRVSTTLKNMGDVYFLNEEYSKSIQHFNRVLPLINNSYEKAFVYVALGNVYSKQSRYKKAVGQFNKALGLFNQSTHAFMKANTLNAQALAYLGMGKSMEAINSAKQAINLAEKNNHTLLESNAWGIRGQAMQNLNKLNEAAKSYQKALESAKQGHGRREEVSAAMGLSIVYRMQGNFNDARDLLDNVLATENLESWVEQLVMVNLGSFYLALGDYNQAVTYFRKNVNLANKNNDIRVVIVAHEKLGNTYYSGGFYKKAAGHYQLALDQAKKHQYTVKQVAALANMSWVYRAKGELQKAKVYAQQAVRLSSQIEDAWVKAEALHALTQLQIYTQDNKSVETAQQLLSLSEQTDSFPVSDAMDILGSAHEHFGNYSKALELYQQSLLLVRESQDRLLEGTILYDLGRLYKRSGKFELAEKKYRQTIEIWESLRTGLGSNENLKVSIFEKQRSTYQGLQSVLISQNKINKALEVSEQGRARTLAELISRHVAKETIQDQFGSQQLADIVSMANQRKITIVEYAVTLESIFIWVIQPSGEIVFKKVYAFMPSAVLTPAALANRTNKDAINVSQIISDTRGVMVAKSKEGIKSKHKPGEINQLMRNLYNLLIVPIASYLPNNPNERVVFIPQGDLFQIPFPALMDENGRYLIEKHSIQISSSLQTLKLANQLRKKQNKAQQQELSLKPLIIGNPTMPSMIDVSENTIKQLNNLPGAGHEALVIAKLLDVSALTGGDATEKTVSKRLKSASLVHFATHGLLDYGNPDASGVRDMPGAIALAPDLTADSTKSDGLLTSSEIMEHSLSAEMVVLSACNTGNGDITADGVIGLSRAFLAAGVPNIVVSLWAVPDEPTSYLMTKFYQFLMKNGNKAQALRHAMMATMVLHPKPQDWAAFMLIGEAL